MNTMSFTNEPDKVPAEDDFLEEEMILFLRGHPAGTKKQDPKGRDLGQVFREALHTRLQVAIRTPRVQAAILQTAMAMPMTHKLDSGITIEISRPTQ